MRFRRAHLCFVFLLAPFLCEVAFASGQEQLIDAVALEYTGMRSGGGADGRERVIDVSALEYTGMRNGGGADGRERVIDAGALEYTGMRSGGSADGRERVVDVGTLEYTGMRGGGGATGRERVIDVGALEYAGMRGGGADGRERVIDAGALEFIGQRAIQNDTKSAPMPAINEARGGDVKAKKPKGAKATNDVVHEINLIKITPRSGFMPFRAQDIRGTFHGKRQNASPPVPPSQDGDMRKAPGAPKKDDDKKQIQELRIEKRSRPDAAPAPKPDNVFTPQSYGTPSQGKP